MVLFFSPAKVTWMDIAAMTGLLFLMAAARLLVPRELPALAQPQDSLPENPQTHTARNAILLVRHRE